MKKALFAIITAVILLASVAVNTGAESALSEDPGVGGDSIQL